MKLSRLGLWFIILLLLLTNIITFIVLTGDSDDNYMVEGTNNIDKKQPLATIGSTEIRSQEWSNQLIDQYGEQVLHDMVDEQVVTQLAEEKDLTIEPKIIDREQARMMAMQGVLTEEDREKKMNKWEKQIKYRYFLQQLLTENVAVSEEEIENYYQNYQGQYQFSDMVQLSHIVVQTEQEAEHVEAKLGEGVSFEEVAKEFSVDEDSARKGGYLGFYTSTSSFIPDAYFEKALSIDEGTYSDPFLTNNGYAVIFHHQYLEEVELSYEEAYEEVRQDLALDQLDKKVEASPLWEQLEVDVLYNK